MNQVLKELRHLNDTNEQVHFIPVVIVEQKFDAHKAFKRIVEPQKHLILRRHWKDQKR